MSNSFFSQHDANKNTLYSNYKTPLYFLLSTLVITALVFCITSQDMLHVAVNILKHPSLLPLNLLPVLLAILLVYFLFGKPLFAVCLSGELFLFFAIADKVKITMRQEPLLPADLTLAKEALTIAKTFPLTQVVFIAILLIAMILLPILAFRYSKKTSLSLKLRGGGFILVILVAFGANSLWYQNTERYNGYETVGNPFFQVNQYNSKGLIYSFFHQANITRVTPPQGYEKATFAALENVPITTDTTKTQPHIIMIMGEAFSDLSENEHLDFTGYRDPLENFKKLSAQENAVSGKIVVSNFGGGTSNTEYDVLTACPTRNLNNPLPSYNFIHKPFDALPHRLEKIGYDTLAIHPGYQWFYNRQNVYPYLGFNNTYFLEDSFDLKTQGIGGYINEKATADKILETFDTHINTTDAPLFSFTVTIQNHGPYENRYGTQAQNLTSDIPLSPTESELLTQYFKGVSDADIELGRIADYAQESTEPIVIVYFGDHLPGFSNGMEFFSLLDYPIDANGTLEERLGLYETPYLIWQNDTANALNNMSRAKEEADLPSDHKINAHYLGALVTELLGMDGLSPLYDFSNELRRELPISTNTIFVDSEGNIKDELEKEQFEKMEKLTKWQYYKLFDQILTK